MIRGRRHRRRPDEIKERIMTRTKLFLLAATCAVTVAFGSPAFALNPQPLPPGRAITATGHPTTFTCVSGNHRGR